MLSRTYSQIPLRHCSSGLQAAKERKERDSCYCININLMSYLHRPTMVQEVPTVPFFLIHFAKIRNTAFICVLISWNTVFGKKKKEEKKAKPNNPTVP